ncbi:MAG: nucleotide exchange factor GrpE [Minisyncoccia bacterium]
MKKDDQEILEEFVPEDGEGNEMPQVARLKEKLKSAEEKAKEYLDNWQRAQADFVNLRKRDEEELKNSKAWAEASFIKEILPVVDSLEKAIEAGNKENEAILGQFMAILKRLGVSLIEPTGEPFDPNLHEAIKTEETNDSKKDHTVASVMQKGFSLNGKVLRPAMVSVYSIGA